MRTLLFLLASVMAGTAAAEPASMVYLNGTPSPVFFNDGDSFRVLSGKYAGTKARLSGYNTLESFGPVHQWGTWTAREMYVIAKMATLNARVGVWKCTSDLEKDTYGRLLWWCPELAEDQIRKGLAHAMTVTQAPADARLLAAQKEAIEARRGMWAHGVPDYVLTSLHSADERPDDTGNYNRLVSSADGHSKKWKHQTVYAECDTLCSPEISPSELAAALKEQALPKEAEGYDDDRLFRLYAHYLKDRTIGAVDADRGLIEEAHRAPLEAAIAAVAAAGPVRACMVYTDFRRRFGGSKAACLK